MKYYPVFLRLEGRACLVVGGGRVAARKIDSLLEAGARVTVIAPRLAPELKARARDLHYLARKYEPGDLRGYCLVCAATDDEALHRRLAQEAETAGVLLNVADRPEHCNFIVPSVLARGDLVVAVSTCGASPALAARVRRDIDRLLGPEYDRALTLLAGLRRALAERPLSERQRIFDELLGGGLIDCLRASDAARVDALLARHVDPSMSLAQLGVAL